MPLNLDAIKARLQPIDPTQWRPAEPAYTDELYANLSGVGDGIWVIAPDRDQGVIPPIATFIEHAPTDIAALVAEVERLRAVLDSSSSALTEIAEDIRRELWLDEQDFRGHKLYDRIMDALPALDDGEVSGG